MKNREAGKLGRQTPASIDVPLGEARVLESHHAAGFEMELDHWAFHKICWVAVGQGQLEFPGSSTATPRNDFLVLPADWPHRFIDDPNEPLTLVIICVDQALTAAGSALKPIWSDVLAPPLPAAVAVSPLVVMVVNPVPPSEKVKTRAALAGCAAKRDRDKARMRCGIFVFMSLVVVCSIIFFDHLL